MLKGLDTVGRLSAIFTKKTNFVTFGFVFRKTKPFLKRINSKRKEFDPIGNKCFSFRVDLFSGGGVAKPI